MHHKEGIDEKETRHINRNENIKETELSETLLRSFTHILKAPLDIGIL